jgi:small subunit ribosomal protein S8
MVSTDPISDMFTRIRNAALVNKADVDVPYSKIKEDIAKILVASGFLQEAKVSESAGRKVLSIAINGQNQPANITSVKRLSRPGRRVYVGSQEIPTVKRGRGLVILSTSKGIMTGSEAARNKIGGELICEVY